MNLSAPRPDRPDIGRPHALFRLIGGFQIEIEGQTVDLGKQKLVAVLALLVAAAPLRLTRERLRGLLWSDSSEANAQNSLRNALSLLRQNLAAHGFDGLRTSRNDVWIDPASFVTDLDGLRVGLAAGQVEGALLSAEGFPGSLLAGLTGSDLFEESLDAFRMAARNDIAAAAQRALGSQGREGRINLLELLADLSPNNEAYHRTLIESLVAAGRKADALAAYQRLWTRLDADFGEEPSAETQALVVALKQDPPSDQGLDRPVILVRLDPESLGASEGRRSRLIDLRNRVLSALARFREWRILDERHVPDPGQLQGRGLLCVLTLVASASGDDPGEPILAILTDLRSGQIIWSDPLGDDRQITPGGLDAAVRRFATAINLLLSGPARPLPPASGDGTAHYGLWIEAQQKLREFTVKGWREAEVALDSILSENPRHVRALSARASIETMRQIAFPGVLPAPALHRRALGWAGAAALADPMDSRAQLALAWACAMSRQFDRAVVAYELAFQHNENDPWTIASSLVGFVFCEAPDRARALSNYLDRLGLALEPFHWSYLAAAAFLLGDDAACIAHSERAKEISCDVPAWHAAALAHSGRIDEARSVASRFVALATAEWTRPTRPSEAEVTGWILSCYPIRARHRWARLRDGLALAGLSTPVT